MNEISKAMSLRTVSELFSIQFRDYMNDDFPILGINPNLMENRAVHLKLGTSCMNFRSFATDNYAGSPAIVKVQISTTKLSWGASKQMRHLVYFSSENVEQDHHVRWQTYML